MSHTSGPWSTSKIGNGHKILSQSGYVLADIADALAYGGKVREKNARLMAMAPNLLASLEAICKAARMADERDQSNAAVPWDLIVAARAEIAKAKGGA